jgi:hypothetical protein
MAAREIARLLQMLGLAVKELQGSQTVNISQTVNNLVMNPAYHKIRGAIVDGLKDFPKREHPCWRGQGRSKETTRRRPKARRPRSN